MPKSIFFILLLLLLTSSLTLALSGENLYRYDELKTQVQIKGAFDLVPQDQAAKLKEAQVKLLLYPVEDYRQRILEIQLQKGAFKDNALTYVWNDGVIETKKFGYTSVIETNNIKLKVNKKIPYPLSSEDIKGYESYTLPTPTIDSDNPKIIKKARELAQNQDDLFKVSFMLASWVESNVKYDLNSLTAQASQKASWVLDNKEGVCDEMSSLFVAMARSLGMPARFVSGISYTTSDLFKENWQPHGWAEVYFPTIGWVPFDIAFGEFGYVDVTHITLREGFDATEPATKYEWLADQVKLNAHPLDFQINILKKGTPIPDEIQLEQEILQKDIGFGSYNLIKGIVKNKADSYAATTLQLAVPSEVEIQGRNRRTILLSPKEVRQTYWVIHIPATLSENYIYQFPSMIYSEKNVTSLDTFSAQKNKEIFSQTDIEKLTIQNEEKAYSRKIILDCNYPHELPLNQKATVQCTIKNSGSLNLQKINICLNKVCEIIDLPSGQTKTTSLTILGETAGWQKIILSAENDLVEQKNALTYLVTDDPNLEIIPQYPSSINYGDNIPLTLTLNKKSFSVPKNLQVTIHSQRFEQKWELSTLEKPEQLTVNLENLPLTRDNAFTILVTWQDSGKTYTSTKEIHITGVALSFGDRIKMILNSIMVLFS